MLTFGFKIFSIAFESGEWNIHGVNPSGNTAAATMQAVRPILWSEARLFDREILEIEPKSKAAPAV
jgi:hypothetical protein